MARKTSKRGYFKSCPVDILQSKDCCCKDTVGPTSLRTYFTLEYANIETLSAVPTTIMTVCVCSNKSTKKTLCTRCIRNYRQICRVTRAAWLRLATAHAVLIITLATRFDIQINVLIIYFFFSYACHLP